MPTEATISFQAAAFEAAAVAAVVAADVRLSFSRVAVSEFPVERGVCDQMMNTRCKVTTASSIVVSAASSVLLTAWTDSSLMSLLFDAIRVSKHTSAMSNSSSLVISCLKGCVITWVCAYEKVCGDDS